MGLNQRLLDSIRDAKYSEPTPIQAQAIPISMEGHDVLGLAQTGTGKTAAFMLPILNKIHGDGKKSIKVPGVCVHFSRWGWISACLPGSNMMIGILSSRALCGLTPSRFR